MIRSGRVLVALCPKRGTRQSGREIGLILTDTRESHFPNGGRVLHFPEPSSAVRAVGETSFPAYLHPAPATGYRARRIQHTHTVS